MELAKKCSLKETFFGLLWLRFQTADLGKRRGLIKERRKFTHIAMRSHRVGFLLNV